MDETQNAKGRQVMKWQDRLRCVDYMRGNRDRILEARPSYSAFGEELIRELKLNVAHIGRSVICSLSKQADVIWSPKFRAKRNRGLSQENKNDTREQLRRLRRLVIELYERFKEPLPDWFTTDPNKVQNNELFAVAPPKE